MIKVKIISGSNVTEVRGFKGERILDLFRREDINLNTPCGGNGRCGKCKVKIIEGNIEVTEADKINFSSEEIEQGWRLCCNSYANEDLTIMLNENINYNILEEYYNFDEEISAIETNPSDDEYDYDFGYAVAVDIGTTTICFELINLLNNESIKSISMINSQTMYGADVITRISEANKGKLLDLSTLIRMDIIKGIKAIAGKYDSSVINKIIISGNTTMIYLLLNMNCSQLGTYPFKINTNKGMKYAYEDIFKTEEYMCQVIILPSITAFAGADIVSGALMCNILERQNSLLIDIGTNGEMILNADGKLFCTSTAAGPAFEGGNISCGIGSVEGAIVSIEYKNGKFEYKTIHEKKAIGICGSGVIDLICSMLKEGFIDNTGLLKDELFESGIKIEENIVFTQKDIRQFQLAKSAVRTGIECLVKNAGIKFNDIQKVYIAGGFGFNLNISNSIDIGLIPKEFKNNITVVGNSSLGGIKTIIKDKVIDKANKIAAETTEIILSEDNNFNDLYIKYMNFCQE